MNRIFLLFVLVSSLASLGIAQTPRHRLRLPPRRRPLLRQRPFQSRTLTSKEWRPRQPMPRQGRSGWHDHGHGWRHSGWRHEERQG